MIKKADSKIEGMRQKNLLIESIEHMESIQINYQLK